jgi:predicted acylesterase/phospholipase RssA
MAKRLAITIAGAVSLGSYEAGVLYELMRAIRSYNEAGPGDDKKIYVDVITGASAGGMTAAMVSQRLMYDAASKGNSPTRSTRRGWNASV